LSLAAALLAVLGLACLGYGITELSRLRTDRPVGAGTGILVLGYGLALLGLAWGVLRGRRWSRAPALASQLIQLPVAWSFRSGGTWWFGLLLGALSATVIVCLLLPSSTAVFVPSESRPEE
jgi:hypothetical protein